MHESDNIKNIIKSIKQRFCKHVFRGDQMILRDENGYVKWPCSKCEKVFIEHCGLDMLNHGEITGPWGVRYARPAQSNKRVA